jgi:ankyrin repeat protein
MQLRDVTICMLVIISFASLLFINTANSYDHTVYQVQKKLEDLGYEPGRPDGIWGKKTTAAVKRFQEDNGLPVTGQLDEQTKSKLSIIKPYSHLSLSEAVRINDIIKVKALLAAGADVNARDKLGETPLHVAAVRGYQETSSLLIAKGADVNAKDERGLTPLHAAAWRGHTETVALLIANGADINARNEDGVTPLHVSALAGHTETIALLITKGVDVNARNADGLTSLHAAALAGHTETVELLITKGADVNAKNEDGLTPLNAASQKGYWAIVELLRRHGTQE